MLPTSLNLAGDVRDYPVTPFHYLENFHYPCLTWTPFLPLSSPGPSRSSCPSPDIGEKGVDVPREHRDHVGDNEGCGRPSHQEEGDESHSPEEAQHRGERAVSSSDHEAGLLRAAWRRWPRHRQLTPGRTEAPRPPGQAQPRREGSAQSRVGGGRTDGRVGGARAVLACCETGEVTKRQPGPAELERAATSPPTPRHAGPLGFLSLLLGTATGGCGGRRRTPRGWPALGQVPPSWLNSQLLLPLGVFPLSLSPALAELPSSVWPPVMRTPSGCAVDARVQAEGLSDVWATGHGRHTHLCDKHRESQIA